MKICGVYKIQSRINKKFYIGSSCDVDKRFYLHRLKLSKNCHHSIILQNHVNKYGIDDLECILLEICNRDSMIYREQYYIDMLNPHFNICKNARNVYGIKRSIETKSKIRESLMGHIVTKETRIKIGKKSIGRKHTEEWKEKMRNKSSWNKGKKLSEVHKNNIKEHRLSYVVSDETKIKIRNAINRYIKLNGPIAAKKYIYNGKEYYTKELCNMLGLNISTFYTRIYRGYSLEEAIKK